MKCSWHVMHADMPICVMCHVMLTYHVSCVMIPRVIHTWICPACWLVWAAACSPGAGRWRGSPSLRTRSWSLTSSWFSVFCSLKEFPEPRFSLRSKTRHCWHGMTLLTWHVIVDSCKVIIISETIVDSTQYKLAAINALWQCLLSFWMCLLTCNPFTNVGIPMVRAGLLFLLPFFRLLFCFSLSLFGP